MDRLGVNSLEEADTIAFSNLKGRRRKDYVLTAEALAFVRTLPDYTSNAKVGARYGVSAEIVREFTGLLDLPPSILQLFEQNKLSLEHGRRLRQLQDQRPDIVEDVAEVVVGLTAHQARELTVHLIRYPDITVDAAMSRIEDSESRTEREYHVVAILDSSDFGRLRRAARAGNQPVDQLVSTIVKKWLGGDRDDV